MRFIGELVKLPIAALTYSLEMFVKTIQGLQRIADQSIDIVLSGTSQIFGGLPAAAPDSRTATIPADTTQEVVLADDTNIKEERRMPDSNLNDDMLKLVRYKILFVKRDYEHAFQEVEELVKENTTDTAYAGWKIAEFIQHLGEKNTPLPKKWKDKGYPPDPKHKSGDWLLGFPDGDKKYLRVFYEVLDRYVREKLEYQDEKLTVLREIRDAARGIQRAEEDKRMPGSKSSGGAGGSGQTGWISGEGD